MHDLNSRLQTYFDEIAPPILEETVRRRAAHRVSRRPRLAGPVIALAVAAALLVLVGAVALVGLIFSNPDRPTVTQPVPSTMPPTVPTTTPTTLPATSVSGATTTAAASAASDALGLSTDAAGSPMGWTRLGYDSAIFGDSRISQVVATSDGFLAFGRNSDGDAVVWTSPDGLSWNRVQHVDFQLPKGSEGLVLVNELIYVDGRFVLLGQSKRFLESYSHTWVSTDGVTWVPHAMPIIRASEISALVVGNLGESRTPQLLAASVGGDPPQALHIFSSVDGESWDLVYVDPDPLPAYPGVGDTSLAVVNGTFIALNSVDPGTGSTKVAVWTADQASAPTEWSRTIQDHACSWLKVVGDRAYTLCGDSVGVTGNGIEWQFAPVDEGIGFLLSDASGSVLIGASPDWSDPRREVLTSDDGVTWTLLPSDDGAVFDGAFPLDFTINHGTSVAVGSACSGGETNEDVCAGVVWVNLP